MKCKNCNESIDLINSIFVNNELFCDDACYKEWNNRNKILIN